MPVFKATQLEVGDAKEGDRLLVVLAILPTLLANAITLAKFLKTL